MPMKVFVVEECWDYEGCNAIGVYTSMEKARKKCEITKEKEGYLAADNYSIKEFTLDNSIYKH